MEIVNDKYDGIGKKQRMIYFLIDKTTRVLSMEDLLMKTTKELKYVHYILKVKDKTTEIWSNIILSKIRKRIMDGSSSYDGKYIPTNIEWSNNEVKMKEKSAVITEFQGVRLIKLNPGGAQLVYIGLGED